MVVGLAALVPGAPAARAQDAAATASPSPKELWEAYPLAPEDAPATATPSEASTEGAASPSRRGAGTPRAAASDDGGGGIPLAVPIGLAAVLAFGAGVGLGRVRRSERLERERLERERLERDEPAAAPAEPATPKRFQWRDYPEPVRPAPPPPPPPPPPPGSGNGHQTFKAALEAKRAATSRAKQEEPH